MRRSIFFVCLLILTILSGGKPAQSQAIGGISVEPEIKLALAGYLPPSMTSIAVEGNFAYIAAGPSLVVVNVSDPEHPSRIGYALLLRVAKKVVASQERVYILTDEDPFDQQDNYIQIIDISIPSSPRLVGEYGPWAVKDLAAAGIGLYLGGQDGLTIVDASDPTEAKIRSILPVGDSQSIKNLVLAGNVVIGLVQAQYSFPAQLWTIDVSDARQPVKLGELSGEDALDVEYPTDLAVSGRLAAVAGFSSSTYDLASYTLVDLSDLAHPNRLGSGGIGTGFYPSVAILGEQLFASTRNDPIVLYDIHDPENPIWLEAGEDPVWDLAASEQQVYVAAGASGLAVYGGQSGGLDKVGALLGIGSAEDIAILDNVLYIADGGADSYFYDTMYGGLAVADAPHPSRLEVVSKIIQDDCLLGGGGHIALEPGRAYLIAGNCFLRYTSCGQALYTLDVSTPKTPALLGSIGFRYDRDSIFAGPVSVQNQIAYLPNHARYGDNGLAIVNSTQPALPSLMSLYRPPTPSGAVWLYVEGAAITGNYGLLTATAHFTQGITSTLHVVDISDPHDILRLTSYTMTRGGNIFIQGSLAFVVDDEPIYDPALNIYNLSKLPALELIATVPMPQTVTGVAYDGRYAYLSMGQAGLRMLDLSDPAHPAEVYRVDTAGDARGVNLYGEWIVLADGPGGLLIYQRVTPRVFLPSISSNKFY